MLLRKPTVMENERTLVYDQKPDFIKALRVMGDLAGVPAHVNVEGLQDLRLSGSGALCSVEQVRHIAQRCNGQPLVVLDLRQESHAIAGGYPVSLRGKTNWANMGLRDDEVERHEAQWAAELGKAPSLTVMNGEYIEGKSPELKEVRLSNPKVMTEREAVLEAGAHYYRLAVSDHLRPDRQAVDGFIDLVRKLPEGAALHVHCKGGKGRTTTFMVMYDMLRNANRLDAAAIIERQCELGNNNKMFRLEEIPESRRSYGEDRLAFLHEFHAYARENPGGWPLTYSQWRLSDAVSNH